MLEVASITLPSSLCQLKSFVANIKGILCIKDIYNQCMTKDESIVQLKKPGADYKEIKQFVKVGKYRKRQCTYVLNH
jgi:hypothetical protein